MKKFRIPNSEVQELLSGKNISFPKYTTQIMNLANSNAQGTRPRVVGQMSDLIQEFPGTSLDEWEAWYREKNPEAIEKATDKVIGMLENFREAIQVIDREMVHKWVEELVIIKTYSGLRFQDAIIKKIADTVDQSYTLASPEDERKGIDGYIGDKPVSIKPITYKNKILPENINEPIIFYDKKKSDVVVEYDLKLD